MEDIGLSELELKLRVVCAGNCIGCGKPINLVMHRADDECRPTSVTASIFVGKE